ncbi:hypothetical protein KY362_02355 [Candidatus Woesearchaeota archaeon]|nr:hypothetical protein [Candidatus Woesearchaeota archaeon]
MADKKRFPEEDKCSICGEVITDWPFAIFNFENRVWNHTSCISDLIRVDDAVTPDKNSHSTDLGRQGH